MIIAIDVDSVMFPVNQLVIIPALRRAGYDVGHEDITTFDYRDCLDPNAQAVAYEQFRKPDLYDLYSVRPSVSSVLNMMRRDHRVIAVSSPFAEHAGSKWRFCQRAGFGHKDIVLCGDKSLVDFDVLVDDRPETVWAIGPERTVIFDQPWNQVVRGFTRAHGWDEVWPAVWSVHKEQEVPYVCKPFHPSPLERDAPGAGALAGGACIHGTHVREPCDLCGLVPQEETYDIR